MKVLYDNCFDSIQGDEKSSVFELIPNVFKDKRGYFSEVLKDEGGWGEKSEYPLWMSHVDWIRQINRSSSQSGVIRGLHAQRGVYCQAKLVEAINRKIYDIIVDARPNSETFGVSKVFLLSPETQNKIFVPRGFLHSFVVPNDSITKDNAIFTYYCDNTYDKNSEICINPKTFLPKFMEHLRGVVKYDVKMNYEMYPLFEMFAKHNEIYSDKDENGMDYEEFMQKTKEEYERSNKLWYR